MARLESERKGGAYPLEEEKWPMLWGLFKPSRATVDAVDDLTGKKIKKPSLRILDPYANTGDCVGYAGKTLNMEVYAIENQKQYADPLIERYGRANALYDDAENVTISGNSFDLIYLNPPYVLDEENKRYTSKTLTTFWPRLQPNGYMVLVMYLHNINRTIMKSFLKRCNYVDIYKFPGKHLGHYTQIALIGQRDPNFSIPSDADIDEALDTGMGFIATPDNLPLITVGTRAYQDFDLYKLPNPILNKNFQFLPRRIDWNDLRKLDIDYGVHTTKEFQSIAKPIPRKRYDRPIGQFHDSQIAIILSSEIIDSIVVTHKGKTALLRGSVKRETILQRTEVKIDTHGNEEQREIYYNKPRQYVAVLTEDGELTEAGEDQLSTLLEPHRDTLSKFINRRLKPTYDKTIIPFWGETFNTHFVEGKYPMYNTQEQVATASTEYLSLNQNLLLSAQMRFGKAQPLDAKLLTPNGWIRMGDVQIGDQVIGSDGKPHDVIGVFPQGKKPIYRVTFNDGGTTECCDEHLWSVQTMWGKWAGRPYRTQSLRQLMDHGIQDAAGNYKFGIPVVDTIEFDEKELPIDPYLLGALLGDETILSSPIAISSADEEILELVENLLPSDVSLHQQAESEYDYRITTGFNSGGVSNTLTKSLRNMDLMETKSHTKFIPKEYIYTSSKNRMALLQGLIDTDGSVKGKSRTTASITTVSEQLANDIQQLVRSLGGLANINLIYNGERRKDKLAYVVTIKLPPHLNGQEFRLTRKLDDFQVRDKFKDPRRTIRNIEYVGEKEAQCIRVDVEDSLYVTDDFIVTHNTSVAITTTLNLKKLDTHKRNAAAGDKESKKIIDDLCERFSRLQGRKITPSQLQGIKPGKVVIVTCPANLPFVWIDAIDQMAPEITARYLDDVHTCAEFFREAKQADESELHVGVISYENLKMAETWRAGWAVESGKNAYTRVSIKDTNGKEIKQIIKKEYCIDPYSGAPIFLKDGRRATPQQLDNTKYNVKKQFFTGEVFDGYIETVIDDKHNPDYGKIVKEKAFKIIRREDGYGLFGDARRWRLPKVGNGRALFEEYEHKLKPRKVRMPIFEKKFEHKDGPRRVIGIREIEVPSRTIVRKRYLKAIDDTEHLDPWLSMQGIHPTVKNSIPKEIRKYMRNKNMTQYRIGTGHKTLDRMMTRKGMFEVDIDATGEKKFANPKYPLSEFIRRKFRNQVALFIIDEVHSIQGLDSDVSKAIRNLSFVADKVIGLTGTLYRGVASTFYNLVFTFNPEVRERFPWPYTKVPWEWVNYMGVIKEEWAHKHEYINGRNTGNTRYIKVSVKEGAGYSPDMFKTIMPLTIFANLDDLGHELTDRIEIPTIINMDNDMRSLWKSVSFELEMYMKECLKHGDASAIAMYYTTLKYMLDGLHRPWTAIHRIKKDRHTKNAEPVIKKVMEIPSLGNELRPKEVHLVNRLNEMIGDGRGCIVHIEQTGLIARDDNLPRDISPRIESIIRDNVSNAKPFVMRANNPSPKNREDFIKDKVKEGYNTLICHPKLIKEGVDMSWASYTAFLEPSSEISVLAQSMMRTTSLKQDRDVVIEFMVYDDVFQRALLQYAANKLAAMSMVHGNERGDLAATTEDVDLQDDMLKLIRDGRLNEINFENADAIANKFSTIKYDDSQSPWMAPARSGKVTEAPKAR